MADQTVVLTVSLQASASHGQAIVLSAQSRMFQLHVQNFKAHNRKYNTFLSILLLTLNAYINSNADPEMTLENTSTTQLNHSQHAYLVDVPQGKSTGQ